MKIYLTRAQSKVFANMDGGYVGDPTGGAAYGEYNDPVTAMVGGSIVSGLMGSNAAHDAASTQAAAGDRASQAQLTAARESNAMQQKMYDENVKRQDPYLQAGNSALSQLQGGMQPGGQFTKNFAPSDLAMDPSYKWRLQQGTQNLNASAAARGMLGSGQNLKDVTDYGQGAASQEYGNAYNRYNTNRENLYSKLSGLTQMGQNTAVGVGTAGMNMAGQQAQNTMTAANNASNYATSGAAAQAAGSMGSANALASGIGGAGNSWMAGQYMNKYTGSGTPAATGNFTPATEFMGPPSSAAGGAASMDWYL
jgi:hypothetical protein